MIAIDANIVIYVLTGNTEFAVPSKNVLERMAEQGGVASVLLLSEVLAQADLSQPEALRQVEHFLRRMRGLRWVDVSEPIALSAADLMRQYPKKLRLADAVHLATAAQAGVEEFWTNDRALGKVSIPGLKIKPLG